MTTYIITYTHPTEPDTALYDTVWATNEEWAKKRFRYSRKGGDECEIISVKEITT